ATDRSCQVQRRGLGCSPRQDEVLQGLEARFVIVDDVLQRGDVRFADGRAAAGERLVQLVGIRRGELGPDGEQVALDGLEESIGEFRRIEGACQSQRRVQLVHLAVCRYAGTVLGR